MSKRNNRTIRTAGMLIVAALIIAGCAAPPPAPTPPPPAPTPAPEAPPAPAPPPVPEIAPAEAKAQAQRLAIEAVDQLQNGDETAARATLERALKLDGSNDLARKLLEQVTADAEKELGPVFFRYTVQRDDSLSKIAQQYMGDRFRFYILAKYNGIANPSRLAAGQVIKVPGRAPPPGATPGVTGTRIQPEPETKPAPEAAPATPPPASTSASERDAAALIAKGIELQRAGNLEGAYTAFSEAAQRDPGNRDAVMQRDGARQAMIRRYDREAAQAFQRQNLDLAIVKWNRVLELDPANQKAKLERERALELKKKMSEKFGAK